MKRVFICHPYNNKRSNLQTITHICRNLTKLGVLPVSPVHAFSYLHDNIPGERSMALEFCEELVEMCNELWLFGEWQKSEGCRKERDVAVQLWKPIYEVVAWKGDMPVFKDGNAPEWLKESGGK